MNSSESEGTVPTYRCNYDCDASAWFLYGLERQVQTGVAVCMENYSFFKVNTYINELGFL